MDRVCKKASQWGAFFVFGVVVCVLATALPLAASADESCAADRIDEWVTVARVVDGDTLRLRDGRSVRFIGINTPEIGRKGKPSEAFAEQARDTLKQLLGANAQVGLRFGRERKDRYGRLLAHVFRADGRSLQAELLTRGLAAQIVLPPNVGMLACYRTAEREARATQLGVWATIYRPQAIAGLSKQTRGFRIIRGTVTSLGESKYSVWLNFPRRAGERVREGVAVRIPRKDLGNFPRGFLAELKGQQIVARGWMFTHKNQLIMLVRHPASLERVAEEPVPVRQQLTAAEPLRLVSARN